MDHESRRTRLVARLELLHLDALLVTRQVNVRYLTGFTGTNGQLLAAADGGILLTDTRYEEQAAREVPDLRREIYREDMLRAVAEACRSAGATRVGFESGGLTHRTWRRLTGIDEVDWMATEDEVERLRWAKDAEEIRSIERAQEATDEAFDRVVGKLGEGVTEREAAFELEVAMRQLGAERIGFDAIVAFGENAAEPHHRPTGRALRRGDVIKLDFGCVMDGYHSDMTRTVAFGEPPSEVVELHDVVRRAQAAGIEALRPGVSGGDADEAARSVIRDAGFADHFGHGVGHGVGLEIHEGPSLRSGNADPIPAGAVVTVEPGIYLPGIGGVRIEDTVVVEDHGPRPLPRSSRDLGVLPP